MVLRKTLHVFCELLHLFTFLNCEILQTPIKCFNTVLFYRSNPNVTGSSIISYTFRNSHAHQLQFSLNCERLGDIPGKIEVQSVDFMLPATQEEYCLDSEATDYTKCPSHAQCSCCTLPMKRCKLSTLHRYQYCNSKKKCILNVDSRFLYTCSGREYICDEENCHSRWAQVSYICIPASEEQFISGIITGLAVVVAVVMVLICFAVMALIYWRCRIFRKRRKEGNKIEEVKKGRGFESETICMEALMQMNKMEMEKMTNAIAVMSDRLDSQLLSNKEGLSTSQRCTEDHTIFDGTRLLQSTTVEINHQANCQEETDLKTRVPPELAMAAANC